MGPKFTELPAEIYAAILAQAPTDERQQTTLSLTRAIPRSPVPLHYLFETVSLKAADNVFQLYRRLRGCTQDVRWVRSFSLKTWTVDADIVVNLVSILPCIERMTLFIGPSFAPEHLEEMLEKPREGLRYLSLRFRPYLPALSIVQDPLHPEIARGQHFAQPLVFFRLEPINTLICSPFLRTLPNLCLRIPLRPVAPFVSQSPQAAPALSILDLSTCNVHPGDVEGLLARFKNLKHLILDGCDIIRGDFHEGDWVAIGRMCALATVKAAKDREKKLKNWLEANATRFESSDKNASQQAAGEVQRRRIRPGRRGLAAATISLRESPPREATPIVRHNIDVPRIRVVPSPPTLRSLSTTSNTHLRDEHAIRIEFEQGWAEGLTRLDAVRGRLYQSWKNGVRVMYVAGDQSTEDGLEGLEDVNDETIFHTIREERGIWPAPVLCLAGSNSDTENHADGCGHAAGSRIWDDNI
ncbi:hypothetical protein ID866_5182 [Astraeus odoratus]|nr:hypothetical protein ID866_5182 [Astraeus odoratus]